MHSVLTEVCSIRVPWFCDVSQCFAHFRTALVQSNLCILKILKDVMRLSNRLWWCNHHPILLANVIGVQCCYMGESWKIMMRCIATSMLALELCYCETLRIFNGRKCCQVALKQSPARILPEKVSLCMCAESPQKRQEDMDDCGFVGNFRYVKSLHCACGHEWAPAFLSRQRGSLHPLLPK